jgi:hypothetical protein
METKTKNILTVLILFVVAIAIYALAVIKVMSQ